MMLMILVKILAVLDNWPVIQYKIVMISDKMLEMLDKVYVML